MMPLAIPAELKKITPFVRRAEELDRDRENPESRLVAYYCRQYAVSVGIPFAQSPGSKQCLAGILENLEQEKKPMSNFTRAEAKFVCRKFADSIFDKADGQDRMGLANKTTAKTFYAAATFYEILHQFYEENEESTEEQEEEKERTVYSKWKATEILKAVKEGRQPTPGGYGEKAEEDEPEATDEPEEMAGPSESDQDHEVDVSLPPPSLPMAMPPPPIVETVEEEDEEEEEEEAKSEEGTEVGLGPPPAYPASTVAPPPEVLVPDDDSPPASMNRPPIKPVSKPKTSSSGGLFGIGKKKASPAKVSNAKLADAIELTNFALSALKNKDVDVGAARLKEALAALGR